MAVKINHILIIIVLIILMLFFYNEKEGSFLEGSENQVYILIAVSLVSLVINIYVKNDFLELLNFCFVLFYICRIPFIFSDDVASDVISRNINFYSIKSSLTVLVVQYVFLVLSILIVNPRFNRKNIKRLSGPTFKNTLKYSFYIIAFNLIYALFFFKMNVNILPSGLAILSAIFTVTSPLGLISLSVLLVDKKTFSKYKYAVIINCALAVFCTLYLGSKSSLLAVILAFILAIVVVHGTSFIIRLRHVLVSFLGVFLSINLFYIGQAFRYFQIGSMNITEMMDYFSKSTENLSILISGISYRIGYLDFFIEKLSNPAYKQLVNFQYYFEAIVDKLTPGFDIFDTPFLSRALYIAYFGTVSEGTNSEQITLFAESHLLFGYFSFIVYLLIIYFIKYAIQRCRFSYGFGYVIFYYYIVAFYYGWINSFGLDMSIAIDIVFNGIFILFSVIVLSPKVKYGTSTYITPKYVTNSNVTPSAEA